MTPSSSLRTNGDAGLPDCQTPVWFAADEVQARTVNLGGPTAVEDGPDTAARCARA